MSIYILFLIIVIFSIEGIQLKSKKLKKLSQILIITVFYLIAGMSYKIHNDYFIYENLYKEINYYNWMYVRLEKGFVFLNALFNRILEFYSFKAMIYLLNLYLIYKGLKKITKKREIYIIIGLMYLLFTQFYSLYLSAFRQSIAIAIFIYSLSYIIRKKIVKYIFCISFAFFFHRSAIILFPIYFILNRKKQISINFNLYFYIISNIIISIPQVREGIVLIFYKIVNILNLGSLSKLYLFKDNNLEIKNIILNVFLIFLYKYLVPKKEYLIVNKMLFCYILIEILSKVIGIFYRVEIYFTIFYCIFLTKIYLNCNKNIILKLLRIILILFLGLNYNIKGIHYYYEKYGAYVPLHFMFENFYKEIKYQDTAEYKHLLERYKSNKNLYELRKQNKEYYID